MSRGTFYVYFPSKRDAFLALGTHSRREAFDVLAQLEAITTPWSAADLERLAERQIEFFDRFGAFIRLWRQVIGDDEAFIRSAVGYERRYAGRLGAELDRLRGRSIGEPTAVGVGYLGMIEATWLMAKRAHSTDRGQAEGAVVALTKQLLV